MRAILVTGSRQWTDVNAIFDRLDIIAHGVYSGYDGWGLLIHGDAKGADAIAHQWGLTRDWNIIRMPADWSNGRGAGHIRNHHMVELLLLLWRSGYDVNVEGFPQGRSAGTRGCLKIAQIEFGKVGLSQELIHVTEGG